MAVARKVPVCPYCGKPIAKAVYKLHTASEGLVGDTFFRWEYEKHECKKMKKSLKDLGKSIAKVWKEKFGDKTFEDIIKENKK